MDLVQIRWQQIRLAEAAQVVSRENIELKKKIAQLQVANSTKSSINTVDSQLVQKLKVFCSAFTYGTAEDVNDLRRMVKEECDLIATYKSQIAAAVLKYIDILRSKDDEIHDMYREQRSLQQQIAELKQKLNESEAVHRGEFSTYEVKIARLQDEIKSLKEDRKALNSELQVQEENNSRSKSLIQSLQLRNQELEQEVSAGRSTMERLKEQYSSDLTQQQETHRIDTQNYEKMIEEMGLENQYLRSSVAELEEQIARLSNAVVGNKSHFAKYVEVKTENLALQSKLESITKQQQRKGSGMVNEASNDINLPALQQPQQRPGRRNTFGDKSAPSSSKQQLPQSQQLPTDEVRRKTLAANSTVAQQSMDGKFQVMNRMLGASSSSQKQQHSLQPEPPLSARSKEEQVYSSSMAVSRSSVAVDGSGGGVSRKMVV